VGSVENNKKIKMKIHTLLFVAAALLLSTVQGFFFNMPAIPWGTTGTKIIYVTDTFWK
jgi:hypothetical protein